MKTLKTNFASCLIFLLSLSCTDKAPPLKLSDALLDNSGSHKPFDAENSKLTPILVGAYEFDLDKDGSSDKVELYNFEEYKGDPGDFQRIRIELASGEVLDEYNLGIKGNKYKPEKNLIDSEFITIVEHGNRVLLMTYGYYFASDPPELTIFEFSTEKPRRIFSKNFLITELILKDKVIFKGNSIYKHPDDEQEPPLYKLAIIENKLELVNDLMHLE